ncbi:MAG TPA: iron uptake system protein EfeO, partial [Solirubrobacterales bacterium]|nr:iron uptake system protein EfeO [Solirubrobacterales bacterium]
LEENTDELVAKTQPFVAAVLAGDVARAKSLYPAARIPYERIEPVAESFGDLDPRIDARANDVPASEFGGFHRIEKALWEEGTAKGMAPVAKQLEADVEELQAKVKNVSLQAVQIANGANELLSEVSASKITGEEERYSHIDLVDFEANVEGAQVAFESVEPLLSAKDPKLAKEIEADFDKVYAALKPYRRGDGFVSYTELTAADTRKLAIVIDTLAEKLSQVPAQIVG